jgi:hypothetical protein
MRKFSLLFISTIAFFNATAQSFIAPVSEFQSSNDCKIELVDGTVVKGKMGMVTFINENISSLTIKDEAGVKHKHKAAEIHRFYVKMGFLAKMDASAEASSSLKEMFKTDFNEINNREYIIYEQALLPKKKNKYRLLQLVNPGFDSRIKVYYNPSGNETSGVSMGDIQLTGGEEKTYLVEIDDKKSILVKKGKYKKQVAELYADCPKLVKILGDEKIKFKNMAAHIFGYDQLCGAEKK